MVQPKLSTLRSERSSPSSNVVLAADSPRSQVLDPSTDIDITLPSVDSEFKIVNRSSNVVTVKASNGDTIDVIVSGYAIFTSITNNPNTAAGWEMTDRVLEGSFDTTVGGFSDISVVNNVGFVVRKNTVTLHIPPITGTSNATFIRMELPDFVRTQRVGDQESIVIQVTNNGVSSSAASRCFVDNNITFVDFRSTLGGSTWTASGAKSIRYYTTMVYKLI